MSDLQWCEFIIKGSGGNLTSWHLVARSGQNYRGVCGRMLTSPPSVTSETAPDAIRGVCRRCDVISRTEKIDPHLRRR